MQEYLLYAGAGIFLLGRLKMMFDARSKLGKRWLFALLFIPFAGTLFMVRFLPLAKSGGMMSIFGLWLMIPFAGNHIRNAQMLESRENLQQISDELLSKEQREVRGKLRLLCIDEKTDKVAQLQIRQKEWYDRLQAQRAALGNDSERLESYNAEAAAYAAFSKVASEEAKDLAALEATR